MKYRWLLTAALAVGACRPEASPTPRAALITAAPTRPTAEIVISGDVPR